MSGHDDKDTNGDNASEPSGSAETHLKAAEAKLERANKERAQADLDERAAVEEIRQAEHEIDVHHDIHFKVDGEPYETMRRNWTPNEILGEFPKLDPTKFYLAKITGKEPIRYDGEKGNIPIELHERDCFQAIPTGPAPVSDGEAPKSGVALFLEGLEKMGFKPSQLKAHADHIVIDYLVPVGRFAGKQVRHGFVVPGDFPMTPPSGPHVSPHIHPLKADGQHPTGGIHSAHAAVFQNALGGEWQYWSRPYPEWPRSKKTAGAYMGHVFKLWATQ
jgi:hypothetical protein